MVETTYWLRLEQTPDGVLIECPNGMTAQMQHAMAQAVGMRQEAYAAGKIPDFESTAIKPFSTEWSNG